MLSYILWHLIHTTNHNIQEPAVAGRPEIWNSVLRISWGRTEIRPLSKEPSSAQISFFIGQEKQSFAFIYLLT
jgi:hypothetical protein